MNKNNLKKLIYLICILSFTTYIIYRIFFTISFNLGVLCFVFSLFLLFIELLDSFDAYVYLFNILIPKNKIINKPNIEEITFPDIDIFIATYNESEQILSNTISKCIELNYPNKELIHIYVCDDGNRNNIKKLAKKYNVNYISRSNRKNFKAGNYNNAIHRTNSPYIVTFDADMAPNQDFLLETIPYFFSEEKVGFVQTPQSFKTPDIFQYRFNLEDKIPYEQDYFYNYINIKKNTYNSTIYCGTNAVILRQALIDANYFSINTLTEDIATGLKIESKGYKGIAIDKNLVYGDSVLDFDGFLKQRTRWARGGIQILKNSHFLTNKGLTIRQKIEYLSCLLYWLFGFKRFIYLLTPLFFVLLNIITIDSNLIMFLSFWIPNYLLRRFVLDFCSNKQHSSTWSKIYETILAPVLFKEVFKELFGIKKIEFEVSPKNINLDNKFTKKIFGLLSSHLILLILNIIGYIVCLYKFIAYDYTLLYLLPIFFIISNIFYLLIAIIFDTNNKNHEVKNTKEFNVNKYSLKSIFLIFKYRMEEKNVK